MHAAIAAIEYHLPERVLSTSDLASEFPDWGVEKIDQTTGIAQRHIAAADECSSDLAIAAAKKLFDSAACSPESIEYVLLCTETPDYWLPSTACLIQDRLGIPTSAGAIDLNTGSSGYVYALGVIEGLILSGQVSNVLLLTAETYSKLIHPRDKSVRTIFGDAASATLVRAVDSPGPLIGPFVYGTDGSGARNLFVPNGGMRHRQIGDSPEITDESGNVRSADNLYMNGGEIFSFTIGAVPRSLDAILKRAGMALDDVDVFVFHQPNKYMLDHLRKRAKIPPEKFVICLNHCGNTVSATIPIALKHAWMEGRVKEGSKILLLGFGAGYSWAATLVRWSGNA